MNRSHFFAGVAVLVISASCDVPSENSTSVFTRLAPEATGIDFNNTNTEDDKNNIVIYEYFYNGGGVALGDINNDGLVDIYFSSNQQANKLYLNKGDFKFEDITDKAGVSCKSGWKTGVSMVDINADGYLDIFVCRSAEDHPLKRENWLFINNKDLTFSNKAAEYGLNDDSYSTQAAFLDHDGDGDLDAFMLNHSLLHISNSFDISQRNTTKRMPYVGNKLYANESGMFRDISDTAGVFGPASNYGLGIVYDDLNNDGWLDIYASCDYTGRDRLLLNRSGKSFSDATDSLLTHISQFSMGVDIADINNDGLPDIFTLDMLPENNKRQKELFWPDRYDVYAGMVKNGLHHQYMRNMLHLNNGDGTYAEIGQLAGISNTDWSWSALLADYDNDGLQDLFISNGYKRDITNNDFLRYRADMSLKLQEGKKIDKISEFINRMPSQKVHNYMFANKDGHSFTDVSAGWGFGEENLTHGVAYGDLDNDGDLDLVMNNMDEVAGIYRNNAEQSTKNYLKVKLLGNDKNTFGLGAKVTVYAGGKVLTRTLCPYRGFQSSMEPALFFGLGKATKVDSLSIRWPRGEVQKITGVEPNQFLTLYQRDAVSEKPQHAIPQTLWEPRPGVIPFTHHENDFVDFKVQPLLPRAYSSEGPALAAGDVNKDGLVDLYVGGARGQEGALFIKNKRGGYTAKKQADFLLDVECEDTDAVFFDADNDNDLDLYVVSGGYEFDAKDKALADRLYRNDGQGNFRKSELLPLAISGSCVRDADVDGDGDLDLFVGGRIVPGRYPETPPSVILINDGKGNFSDGTAAFAPALGQAGLVTDAQWADLNNDSKPDLIVLGEWMPIRFFINEGGKLVDKTDIWLPGKTNGWWSAITVADFDNDGDQDVVAGNFGMNNQFKATPATPMTLHYADYDNNGSVDPLISYFIGGQDYPSATRDELTDQVPGFKKRFTDYQSYTEATIKSILTQHESSQSSVLTAYTLESVYLQNNGDSFTMRTLPIEAQYAPIFALHATDVNNDGHLDLITAGNLEKTRTRFGKATANFGFIFLGNGQGDFKYLSQDAGICIRGDVRGIVSDKSRIIFSVNDDSPEVYDLKEGVKR